MRIRLTLSVLTAIAFTFSPAAALVAHADDAPPAAAPATPPPSFRPPAGVLRHVDAPLASPASAPARPTTATADRELVILVGGYQSCSCNDPTFDSLITRLTAEGYEVRRFGQDPRFPYDTYGHIDANAGNLRDEIRAVSPAYGAVHVIAHSMGGVVADRAFAQGLSAEDGVATYVSLSAPHSGSDAAVAATLLDRIGASELVHRLASLAGLETRSDAVADLATTRPVPAPAGVVRVDLRASTDVLVTARDARDPGVPSRILSGTWDGHGGILADPQAIDLTLRTIATRRLPLDERPVERIAEARRQSDVLGALVAIAIVSATIYLALKRFGAVRTIEDILAQRLPTARRRRCA